MARGENSLIAPVDLSGLESLMEDLGSSAEDAIRPAAQAGIQVLYDAVKSNVAAIPRVSGNLAGAIYQVYSRSSSGPLQAAYHLSWNAGKAPHGGLVEYGHWQRYVIVRTRKGPRPAVRPEMQGRPKPGRRASQTEKDAYYVPRPGGPVYVPGKAFMRRAQSSFGLAAEASAAVLFLALEKVK